MAAVALTKAFYYLLIASVVERIENDGGTNIPFYYLLIASRTCGTT